ncbi:MiaB/RimO family radical SAM methylthiotransferase [Desulfonatronospira sp.]|uniref:MiaB/RimO family radical SAM methylthiotransferase n=1 Tax=Desulfonatronospira sp. TaxID=1962951 RepID=UPI0025BE9759|nr:MiaB/RimO family radical SAM methylthiotransferase [Desulfonatronospira sp.]
MNKNSFYMATMGCRVNQYESQAISEALQRHGLVQAEDPGSAGNIYINSCAVTSRAVRDLKKTLRRLHAQAPDARIVVTGCAAQAFEKELQDLKEVDLVVPQSRKINLLASPFPETALDSRDLDWCISSYFRARPVVKVQDGCARGCTYCIVPRTRGAPRSRTPGAILQEIRRLLGRGYRETVLCGINLSQYGQDLNPRMDFWDLAAFLEHNLAPEWRDRMRLRISSLDPSQLHTRALEIISQSRMLCPHLHLALQSASPRILSRMGRSHYHPSEVDAFVKGLESTLPLFALGADVLVGFPGEEEADFRATVDMIHFLPLSYAHVFTFSPRPGTAAAGFQGRISEREKNRRSARIKEILQQKRNRFAGRLLKVNSLHLIMENSFKGMSQYYMECLIKEPSGELRPGDQVTAAPINIQGSKLLVEVLARCW